MVEEKEIVSCPPEQDLNEMMRVRREKMDAFSLHRGLLRLGIVSKSRTTQRI